MKKFIQILLSSVVLAGSANAAILTFDNVPGGSTQNSYGDMPTYQGFNFSFTLDWIDLVGSTWNFGAHSGDFGVLNNNSGVGTVTATDGSDFTFDGIWAKQWATGIESGGPATLFGTIEGWNNGAMVWSAPTALNGSYQFIAGQTGAIDELRLGFGNHFLIDDLALNNSASNSVPEPSSLLLAGLALVGLGAARKRASSAG